MNKKITCIECPNGCLLTVKIVKGKIVSVEGNKCEKGNVYAKCEINNPVRILTTSVVAKGLSVRMISVKTSKPIPKDKLFDAMYEVKKVAVQKPVDVGDVIIKNILNLDVDLVATRRVDR